MHGRGVDMKSPTRISTAEGVENIRQMNFFGQHGVCLQQGHLFSEPVTAGEFRRMLDKQVSPGGPLNLVR